MRLTAIAVVFALGCGSSPATSETAESAPRRPEATAGAEPEPAAETEAERAVRETDALLLAALAPGSGDTSVLAAADELACAVDADCVLTEFVACCSDPLCPADARAVSRAWLDRQIAPCAVVECSGRVTAEPTCAAAPSFAAACVAGTCTRR